MKQSDKRLIQNMVAKDVKKQEQHEKEYDQAVLRAYARMVLQLPLHFLPKQQSSKERFKELMEG